MSFEEFTESLRQAAPPKGLNTPIKALWQDAKGNWGKAHDLVDGMEGRLPAHIHAYLHRKEGDLWNADYWYRKAGASRPGVSLEKEWENLVRSLLEESR